MVTGTSGAGQSCHPLVAGCGFLPLPRLTESSEPAQKLGLRGCLVSLQNETAELAAELNQTSKLWRLYHVPWISVAGARGTMGFMGKRGEAADKTGQRSDLLVPAVAFGF